MLILNAQELESQGIPYRAASKILFQERLFVKGQSFSQRVRQVALRLYQEYLSSGVHCLLVESAEQLTFWRELEVTQSISASAKMKAIPDPARQTEQRSANQQQAIESDQVIHIELHRRETAFSSASAQPAQAQAKPEVMLKVRYRGAIVNVKQVEVLSGSVSSGSVSSGSVSSESASSASPNPVASHPAQTVRRTYRGAAY